MEGIWGLIGSVIALLGVFGVQLIKMFRDSGIIKNINQNTDRIEPIEKNTEKIYEQTNNMNPKVDVLFSKMDTIHNIQSEIKNLSEVTTNVRSIVNHIEYEKALRENSSFAHANQIQAAIGAVYEKNANLEIQLNKAYEKNKELEMKVTQLTVQNQYYKKEVERLKEEIRNIDMPNLDLTPKKNITNDRGIIR